MPLKYEHNKKHIYAWRVKNPEKNRETNRVASAKKYEWKKAIKTLMNILMPNDLPVNNIQLKHQENNINKEKSEVFDEFETSFIQGYRINCLSLEALIVELKPIALKKFPHLSDYISNREYLYSILTNVLSQEELTIWNKFEEHKRANENKKKLKNNEEEEMLAKSRKTITNKFSRWFKRVGKAIYGDDFQFNEPPETPDISKEKEVKVIEEVIENEIKTTPKKQTDSTKLLKTEFVYVLSNPSFEANILKVGWSRNHPALRAGTLFTTGLPTPFVIEFIITTCDGSTLENQIHNHIKEYRVNKKREFFKIPKDVLHKILTQELHLEISTNELNIPTNIKSKKNIIYEIVENYERVEKKLNVFLNKLKQHKTKLQIIEEKDGEIIHIQVIHDTNCDLNCLQRLYYDDEIDVGIVFKTERIECDMKSHKKTLDYVLNNHEEIKKQLGGSLFRRDNISFKNRILETEEELDFLLNKFSEKTV